MRIAFTQIVVLTKRPRGSSQRRRGGWGQGPLSQSTCPLSTCNRFVRLVHLVDLLVIILCCCCLKVLLFVAAENLTWISEAGVCTRAAKTGTPGRRYSKGRSWWSNHLKCWTIFTNTFTANTKAGPGGGIIWNVFTLASYNDDIVEIQHGQVLVCWMMLMLMTIMMMMILIAAGWAAFFNNNFIDRVVQHLLHQLHLPSSLSSLRFWWLWWFNHNMINNWLWFVIVLLSSRPPPLQKMWSRPLRSSHCQTPRSPASPPSFKINAHV